MSLNDYSNEKINFDQYLGSVTTARYLTSSPEALCQQITFNVKAEKATNGKEGIDKVNQRTMQDEQGPCICNKNNHNYKLIFMDCNMPIMDGFEATIAIRDLQSINQKEIQIVALTANTNVSFKKKCYQSGMNEYLTKPVSVDQLRKTLLKYNIMTNQA
ncbi:multi-sensor hybrid histidine kinase [Stylonychia lemnae]|uniref:Multi-sensor hybrid histidine kinase n=1 Tax=Stylonychia lemnae TaxID=5949 RepID=A0A078A2J8_STYLE|nr:multi-sensor hybrid histidine kinase [Stylonychia lemnae]|eukprot:CDW75004.1 multi-sensor hybrid histidine kinase [Stylonychia lemnae]